ncbi:phosphatase PAP2 family protein [Azorhizobium sp. AG788]|uniref:phosphatase PAP2 family protein n=1 Tax=Azorhizobium sp. AG788 TaxID=2183897 RepID=UPI00313966A1
MSAGEAKALAQGQGLVHRLVRDAWGAVTGLFAALEVLRRRPRRGVVPRIRLDGIVELVALSILVCGVAAASMILVDPLIPGLRARVPLEVVRFFERVTDLGLGSVVLWPLGLALLVTLGAMPYLDPIRRRVAAAVAARLGFVFTCVVGISLPVLVIKYVLGRARPSAALALAGPHAQLTFDWFAMRPSYASFPSGHSTVVFAVAVALAALYPRARWPLMALAVLVASSRVVLGSHYPSDVLAGAALATAFTLWMVKVFAAKRLVFAVAADGTIVPKAGPSMRRILALFSSSHRDLGLEEARS